MEIDRGSEYVQLFANARNKAARRAIEFSVTQEYFMSLVKKQEGYCSVTGMEFDFRPSMSGKKRPFFPSIDRIDSDKGYTKGNIRIVVTIANYAMNEWGHDPLFEMVDAIIATRRAKSERERKEQELLNSLNECAITKEIYLNRAETADYINSLGLPISKLTLQKYATVGGGPKYQRFGHRAVYLASEINTWVRNKITAPMASTS